MNIILGGVRGTNPVAHADFMEFGGETTSFLIEGVSGERVLIDAGSGVRKLGQRILKENATRDILLLMTHYHLDHVAGLPSLPLIYMEGWSITLAAPVRGEFRIDEVMPRVMDRPFWPLQVEDLASHIRFRSLDEQSVETPLRYGGLEIRWCPVHHPGGCTAYRIDEPATRTSVVVATDMEWSESTSDERQAITRLCAQPYPASLMLMDGQFTPEEYARFKGWGHSTWRECSDLARHCAVGSLLITHHAPDRNDAALLAIEKAVKTHLPAAALAREGQIIELRAVSPQQQQ